MLTGLALTATVEGLNPCCNGMTIEYENNYSCGMHLMS